MFLSICPFPVEDQPRLLAFCTGKRSSVAMAVLRLDPPSALSEHDVGVVEGRPGKVPGDAWSGEQGHRALGWKASRNWRPRLHSEAWKAAQPGREGVRGWGTARGFDPAAGCDRSGKILARSSLEASLSSPNIQSVSGRPARAFLSCGHPGFCPIFCLMAAESPAMVKGKSPLGVSPFSRLLPSSLGRATAPTPFSSLRPAWCK